MLQNVQMALDFLRFKKIKLVNIRAEDITDGSPKVRIENLSRAMMINFVYFFINSLHLVSSGPSFYISRWVLKYNAKKINSASWMLSKLIILRCLSTLKYIVQLLSEKTNIPSLHTICRKSGGGR